MGALGGKGISMVEKCNIQNKRLGTEAVATSCKISPLTWPLNRSSTIQAVQFGIVQFRKMDPRVFFLISRNTHFLPPRGPCPFWIARGGPAQRFLSRGLSASAERWAQRKMWERAPEVDRINPLVPRVQKLKSANLTLNRLWMALFVKEMVYLNVVIVRFWDLFVNKVIVGCLQQLDLKNKNKT